MHDPNQNNLITATKIADLVSDSYKGVSTKTSYITDIIF